MSFKVDTVRTAAFPSNEVVQRALAMFGTSIDGIEEVLGTFSCPEPQVEGEGYQQAIASSMEEYLQKELGAMGCIPAENRYSPELNERADVTLTKHGIPTSLFIEIEFRPNVEKDLVKFQLGSNSGLLGAAMLVLALDRNSINPSYTTMSEFDKYNKIIQFLRPNYPLLLVGFSGAHVEPENERSSPLVAEPVEQVAGGYVTGALLNDLWKVGAKHALYHHEGTWYNVLTDFPGALFDPTGYILFKTQDEFRSCRQLAIGIRVNVHKGISNIPGYVRIR